MWNYLKNKILFFIFWFLLFSVSSHSYSSLEQKKERIIEDKEGNYSFFVDPQAWKIVKSFKKSEEATIFCLEKTRIYGSFLIKNKEKEENSSNGRSFFLNKVNQYLRDLEILYEEEREINKSKILYLQLGGKIWYSRVIFDAYIYEEEKFLLVVCVSSTKSIRHRYVEKIQEFLNGLNIHMEFSSFKMHPIYPS